MRGVTAGLTVALLAAAAMPAAAQKPGGTLRIFDSNGPASMSIHEESTRYAITPAMAVFNNLVLFDQHVPQNTFATIRPELAESWVWDSAGTALTFKLRSGVKWHDGKPFTAADVKCTWDLLAGRASEKFRVDPRKSWYRNLDDVSVDNDHQVTFHLKAPQPSLLALLASGASPVYPCHVTPAQMRQHPIGTGPFKFVEYKPNESIKLVRNPDYWKPGRPYLDAIEYSIIPNPATQLLAFAAGKFDMSFPYAVSIPLMRDVAKQAPEAICDLTLDNGSRTLIINQSKAPFDNPRLRRAMALTLDRKAFIDILTEGHGVVGGAMLPPPEGVWGMPADQLATLPGYDGDVARRRAEARKIMEDLGYGPDKRLTVSVTTRNIPGYRDPTVILIDQLKEIYIDGQLDAVDTPVYFPKLLRKDYTVGLTVTETALDDPDQMFFENYVCGAERNYTGYCNPEFDALVARQSAESDFAKRRDLVWQAERKLADDGVRPVIFYTRGATCRTPRVKGMTLMVNSLFNGWRMEDIWLDQ
ncbi:MAG TPA: ABC transporter substrate-binding protein [Stellaceae bacterium]|nr:ABC transporter substrate-binding protein [Stellaceae bacterium]